MSNKKEYMKKWHQSHPEYWKEYYQREDVKEHRKKYNKEYKQRDYVKEKQKKISTTRRC